MFKCANGHVSSPHEVETQIASSAREVTYITYRVGRGRDGKETIKEVSSTRGLEVMRGASVCPEHIEEFEAQSLPTDEEKVVETYIDRKNRFISSKVKTAKDLEQEAAEAYATQVAEAGAQEWDDDSWEEIDDDLF